MAMEVYIEYRVDWEASTGEFGIIDPLAGNSLGAFQLSVGEIQSIGTLGDDPHPDDPGITSAELGSRPECTIYMLATGQCSDPQDPPLPSEPGTPGKDQPDCSVGSLLNPTNWLSDGVDCVKEGVGEVIDYVKEKAAAVYAILPGPLKAVVDILNGCAAFVGDAAKNLWGTLVQLSSAAAHPQEFINEQLEVLRTLKQALEADPIGFAKEFLGNELELDLLRDKPAEWFGKIGCEVAVALFSAGVGSGTRIGKIFQRINDIKAWVKNKVNLPGDGRDRTPDGDVPGDQTPDGDGPTCSLGGKCGCNSFPSGTLVVLADGSRIPIDRIEPGDRVVTYDTVNEVWRNQSVLARWSAVDHGSMATATLAGGGTLTATDGHRFWVDGNGAWVDLADLKPGDLLLTPDGVSTVAAVDVAEPTATLVWELDVAFDDNFVVTQGGAGADTRPASALVHNGGCKNRTEFGDSLDTSATSKADDLLELNRLNNRRDELRAKDSLTDAERAELNRLDQRTDLISNQELRRRAALSEGGSFEHDVRSGTFTNLQAPLDKFNPTDGVQFDPAANTLRVTDSDAYLSFVESKYTGAGQTLNPKTRELIRAYVDNPANQPLSSFDGAPGLHAEIQAFNDVVNQLDARGVDYTMSDIQVATRKLSDRTGDPFPACSNCAGILPPEVTRVTG